jgi:hypothetical protein
MKSEPCSETKGNPMRSFTTGPRLFQRLGLPLCLLTAHVVLAADPLITRQEAKLTAADGAASDDFGGAVSLSGDRNTALVSAYTDDTTRGTDAGSAYVLVRSGSAWIQQAKLTAGDGAASDWFGSAVSLSRDGQTALVGAFWDDTPRGANAGSAYVFVRNGTNWTQQAKLTAADGAADDNFGNSASLSGDGSVALVGAPSHNTTAGSDAGSAYVFVRSGTNWSQQARLTADDAAASDWLGTAVSLSGDGQTALVGARATTPRQGRRREAHTSFSGAGTLGVNRPS